MSSEAPHRDQQDEGASIFDAPHHGLRGRFAGGAVFTLASQAIRLLVQIAALAILSRLLAPISFGIMAMASPVFLFAFLLQEAGLTQATVQKAVLTQQQASNMFWASATLGAAVALLLAAAAPLVSLFYHDGRVGQILLASAPAAVVLGMGNQYRALLQRKMMFRQAAIRDIVGVIAGMAAAVICAIIWRNYWALYAWNTTSVVVTTVGTMLATRWMPSLPRRDPEFKKMLGFGAGVGGYFLANFITRNMDNVLIGRRWGGAALGLYDRGYRMLLFPLQQINQPIMQVMVPTLSKLSNEAERYRQAYLRVMRVLLMVTVPGILALYLLADWVVPLVLGPQWMGVVPIFRNLALAGAMQTFSAPLGALFITQGRTTQFARWGVFSAVVCTAAFLIGLPWGPTGVALAYALEETFFRMPLYWWYATREGAVRLRDLGSLGAPFTLAAVASGLLMEGGRLFWSPPHPFLGLAIYGPACYAAFWGVMALFPSGRATLEAGTGLVLDFARMLLRSFRPSAGAEPAGAKGGDH